MSIESEFELIRDIPYSIPLSATEESHSCSGKVVMLKASLSKNNIESRYRVCDFLWSDLPLPKEVLDIPHDDRSTHVYLEIYMNGEWIVVDPTWDSGLKAVLHINEWDGVSSMPIAVKSLGRYSIEDSESIMENTDSAKAQGEIERNKNFYIGLNEWFQGVRV